MSETFCPVRQIIEYASSREGPKRGGRRAALTTGEISLPLMDHIPRLNSPPKTQRPVSTDSGPMVAAWQNGYIKATMLRVKLLHQHLCKHIGEHSDVCRPSMEVQLGLKRDSCTCRLGR